MAIARLFSATASVETASGSYAPSITWGAATAVGDLIVVTLVRDDATTDSATPTDTLTDNKGNTYTRASGVSFLSNAGDVAAFLFYCNAAQAIPNGTAVTLTWTLQSSRTAKAVIVEAFSGVATSSPLDVAATPVHLANLASASITITPATAGNLVYGAILREGNAADVYTDDTDTTDGSWSASVKVGSGSGGTGSVVALRQYKITTGTSLQTFNLSSSQTRDGYLLAASFKVAAGGVSRTLDAKVPTSSSAKATTVARSRPVAGKAATSSGARGSALSRARPITAKAGSATGATGSLTTTGGIRLVQKQQAANVTGTTITATLPATPTAGNVLISAIGTGFVNGLTITPPTGWTIAAQENTHNTGGGPRWMALAYKVAGASEPAAVTWTVSASINLDAIAFEYSGLDTSSLVDQTVTAYTTTQVNAWTIGPTGTTTRPNELAIAASVIANARTAEAFTNGYTRQSNSGSRSLVGTKTLAATGTETTDASWSGATSEFAGVIVTFRGTGAGVARTLAAKVPTASSAKANPVRRLRAVAAKAGTASGAKATTVARSRPLAAKVPTASAVRPVLSVVRGVRALAAKPATASSAKATTLTRRRGYAAKVATASSAKANPVRRTRTLVAKVPTAASAKATTVRRLRRIGAKVPTSVAAKGTALGRPQRFAAKVATAASARALTLVRRRALATLVPSTASARANLDVSRLGGYPWVWTGTEWVRYPMKQWTNVAGPWRWRTVPLKRWTGTAWERV